MKSSKGIITPFGRSVWLMLSFCVLILCGPVKRLIVLELSDHTTSSQLIEKQLKTYYREKRDNSISLHFFHNPGPARAGAGLTLIMIPLLLSPFFNVKAVSAKDYSFAVVPMRHPVPLYIHIRRLQV